MFADLSDEKFLDLIFTEEDRLGMDYIEEAKKRRNVVIPFLTRVLQERKNYQAEGKKFWAIVHAIYILGILGDIKAFDALLSASQFGNLFDIDWTWEALPECYLRLGKEAIPRLMEFIEESKESESLAVSSELTGLWNFWEAYPEEKKRIEDFALKIIKDPDTHPEVRADLIASLAEIGRKDLNPFFDELFERGEVDLDTVNGDDLDYFLNHEPMLPGHHDDLEGFYAVENIKKRQQRWKEEAQKEEQDHFEEQILKNLNQISRNAPCPCGSGKKFKKCHLLWAEEEQRRRAEEEDKEDEYLVTRRTISAERIAEMEIRQFLARKNQTALFAEIKAKALEAAKTPDREFQHRGYEKYFEPIFSKINFEGKKDFENFLAPFLEYFDAVATQLVDAPKDKNSIH
jgi:hypothetical protein